MKITEEQVISLAPDNASIKTGKSQGVLSKWLILGEQEEVVWGEIKGSGKKPYRVQIDKRDMATKCSCPSRKFPCKHALGLLFVYAKTPKEFEETSMPEWVESWIVKRRQKKAKEPSKKTINQEAQQKRIASREKKIAQGIEELHIWLKDICRAGLIKVQGYDQRFWQSMAQRLVDAQASGLASMVRTMGNINFYGENWQISLLQQITNLYLISTAISYMAYSFEFYCM